MYKTYDKLLFFSIPKILSLHKILVVTDVSIDKIVQEIGFLFKNDPEATGKLKIAIKVIIRYIANKLSLVNTKQSVCVCVCVSYAYSCHWICKNHPCSYVQTNSEIYFTPQA